MARTAPKSKEKRQSIITLRHEGQSIQKMSRTLNISSSVVAKPSSAMMKLALMKTATGKEDPELTLFQRISSLEFTAPQIAAQINASQSSSNRHISASTERRRKLHESHLHGQNDEKKPLLKNTNKKKRLAWVKKHEQWTLDGGNLSFGLMSPNLIFLVPTGFVRCRVVEWMISVSTVKH